MANIMLTSREFPSMVVSYYAIEMLTWPNALDTSTRTAVNQCLRPVYAQDAFHVWGNFLKLFKRAKQTGHLNEHVSFWSFNLKHGIREATCWPLRRSLLRTRDCEFQGKQKLFSIVWDSACTTDPTRYTEKASLCTHSFWLCYTESVRRARNLALFAVPCTLTVCQVHIKIRK